MDDEAVTISWKNEMDSTPGDDRMRSIDGFVVILQNISVMATYSCEAIEFGMARSAKWKATSGISSPYRIAAERRPGACGSGTDGCR